MAFCTNCGQELVEEAKFCSGCGKAISENTENFERKSVYEGEIHKCPNCGDVIDAYETVCEACGFEIRGRKTTSVVHELALKLEKFDDMQKKEELIRNFYIPNTKEDIYEFMFLANSNIGNEDCMENAWIAKFEQAYQKGKLVFKDFTQIDTIYKEFKTKVRNSRNKRRIKAICKDKKIIFTIGATIIVIISLILGTISYHKAQHDIENEVERLNSVCREIEEAIKQKDYALAESKTQLLVFSVHNLYSQKYEDDWRYKDTDYSIAIDKAKEMDELENTKKSPLRDADSNNTPNSSKESTQNKDEVMDEYIIDFSTAEKFEKALNDGEKVKGKVVKFYVNAYKPESALGINCWAGEHLNFISKSSLDVEEGNYIVGRITKEPTKILGSWKISYEVLEIID